MLQRFLPLALVAALGVGAPQILTAQDGSAPLVRERPEVGVSAPSQRGAERERERDRLLRPQETPAPRATPDPNLTLVAIVNSHRITRAELDCRIEALTGFDLQELESTSARQRRETESLVGSLVGLGSDIRVQTPDEELETFQEEQVEAAIRDQEEQIAFDWIDQMMLADEARRQGFIISNEEFESRKREFERKFDLADRSVDEMLNSMCLDRAQLDSFLYDAMLIERLLDRYIELNFPEEQLREAYDSNPGLFMTPPAYRLARFTVSVSENDSNRVRQGLERRANEVRRRMRSGEEPNAIFEELNDFELGVLGSELVWSVTSDQIDPQTREKLQDMRPGEVSNVYSTWVRGNDGQPVPEAFHVIKLQEVIPATGGSFESARPRVLEMAGELSREALLERLREARTHHVVLNLGGISPERVPSAAQLREQRPPLDLRMAAGDRNQRSSQ